MDSPWSDIEKYVSKDVPVLVWHSYHANDNSSINVDVQKLPLTPSQLVTWLPVR